MPPPQTAIPPKKKRRKKTLKSYFKPKKNFQGKNLKYCKYRHEVKAKVYVPGVTKHGLEYGANWAKKGRSVDFCCDCLLAPCISKEYRGDIVNLSSELSELWGSDEATEKVEQMMRMKMTFWFGSRCVSKLPTPPCIRRAIDKELSVVMTNEEMEVEDLMSDNEEDNDDLDVTLASLKVA